MAYTLECIYGTYGELILGDVGEVRFLYNGRFGVITDENNLYYMRARYYNVDIKRFINQDIITGEISNSQSLNRYAYCQGNPVNYMDPFGLSPMEMISAAGHSILNALGLLPNGAVFDLINSVLYFIEGKTAESIICFLSSLPLFGSIAGTYNLTKTAKGIRIVANAGKIYIGGQGAIDNLNYMHEMYKNGTGHWYDYLREGGMCVLNIVTCAGGASGLLDDFNDIARQMRLAEQQRMCDIASQAVARDLDIDMQMSGDEWEIYFKYQYGDEDVVRGFGDSVQSGRNSKIGDFTNLAGGTVDDVLDRIPDEAIIRELYPVEGGSTEGFEFKWVQEGQTYRVRVHNQDPGAPANSNAANGWIVRIQRGTQYYDYTINEFQPARFTNPRGPYFDENIMNNTHIPILDPYK